MARIPFTLEVWLKDKSQKVETGEGESVRILCTNAEGVLPIIGNVGEESENLQRWTEKGQYHVGLNTPNKDLFIVTPEEELSEFENRLCEILDYAINYHIHSTPEKIIEDTKKLAPELLDLARTELIYQGNIILSTEESKKRFAEAQEKGRKDAVKNISDKHWAEMSVEYSIHCKVKDGTRNAVMNWDEFQKVAQKFIDIGKVEALKDIVSFIQSRLNEIIGDAQPKPILRAELQGLIKRITEEE